VLAVLSRPLSAPQLVTAAVGICVCIALYCLAYSALAGRPEPVGQALGWAVVNVLPWLLAFEAGKRARRLAGWALALAAAFSTSLLMELLLDAGASLGFEAVRRIPGLLATTGLLGLLQLTKARHVVSDEPVDLPLAPEQIEWVSAAGNYIEIRGAGRTLIRRASLAAAERELLRHGFVRIHRSTLVRRDRIARVRPADVVLHDGTSLKTGKRYRSSLG
jgi:hypothetical protein